MHEIRNNLGYAFRQLRRSPGFAFTVALTLALGVGANALVFSVLNALILRPLALPHAERLQFFNRTGSGSDSAQSSAAESWPDYRDVQKQNHTFSGIASYRLVPVGVRRGDTASRSWICEASGNYFDVLGVQPELGRFFHAADEHGPNGSPYAVLSYTFWQTRFGGDRSIVGRAIELNKHPFTVLGVAPASFTGTELFLAPDLWASIMNAPQLEGFNFFENRGNQGNWWIGRLKPGVSVPEAEADINTLARGMAAADTQNDEGLHFRLSPPGLIGETLGRPVRAFLYGVMLLAALVLLAACANLGTLFAARAADRSRELAVRMALGATRGVLLRQLLAEALLLSLFGGAIGLADAAALLHALRFWRPSSELPVQFAIHPDLRVMLFACALSVGSGVFFGLVPLQQLWRTNAYALIKGGTAGLVRGRLRWTLRDVLLVTQIVLCAILLTAALVAVRGLARSLHSSYGFNPRGALLAGFDLKMAGYKDDAALEVQHRALDAVLALPGVSAAAFANTLPLAVDNSDTAIYRDGTTDLRPANLAADANYYEISPGYLKVAGTRLLAGREFTWHDDANSPKVAIVNQQFAREVFGVKGNAADALGRYFLSEGRRQVVGIVEDGRYVTLTEDPQAALFRPVAQQPDAQTVMIVRGQGSSAVPAASVLAAIKAVDPGVPVELTSWQQAIGMALFPAVAATAALGVMGGLAALLAVTGIFGMASYSVSKRMRELGLRVALGADRRQLLAAALGKPARLLGLGSVCGLALGALAGKLLAHIVYQASSKDPVVLLGVVASMALLAFMATWLPARRALRADPAQLLREE